MRGSFSPATLRWLGLVCTGLMAASAYLAGSPVHRGPDWVAGVAIWLVGAGGLVFVWWRLRVVAEPGWLLVTGVLWALPLLLAPPLGSHDVYAYACQGELVAAGLDPYTEGPDALPCRWLAAVPPAWRGTSSPYGPLWLVVERLAVGVAHGSLPVAVTILRLVAVAGTLLATVAGARLARRCGGDPARVVWLGAISPLALVHVVSGAHNDALLAGLVVVGLAAATEQRPVTARMALAGAAFGLAAGIKATALVVVPFVIATVPKCRTGYRRVVAGATLAATTAGTFAVLAAVTGHGLGFVRGWPATAGTVQWSSIPTGIGMAAGYGLRVIDRPEAFAIAVGAARLAGLGALAAVLFVLWRRAVRGGSVVAIRSAGAALLAIALLGPVFYAWYAIAGLAVLAAAALLGRLATMLSAGSAGLIFLTLPDSLGLVTKTKVLGALLDVLLVIWATAWQARQARQARQDRQARALRSSGYGEARNVIKFRQF